MNNLDTRDADTVLGAAVLALTILSNESLPDAAARQAAYEMLERALYPLAGSGKDA